MTGKAAFAQAKLEGRVLDENGRGLAAASVRIEDLGLHIHTDSAGFYALDLRGNIPKTVTLRYTFIGYGTQTKTLDINGLQAVPPVVMRLSSLSLEEIAVQARPGNRSNSSLVLDRETIERYPSLSLNDLLNFLPNRKIAAPSVQQMQNLTLRGAFQNGVDRMNNAFGVSIIMDDIAMGNNANMQGRNPNIRGMANASLSIRGNDYGLSGDKGGNEAYSGENAFAGVDLRQIPTENIERIEVISGVASVRYGDASEGAVIIEQQAGRTPFFARVQMRSNATQYGISKGFALAPRLGHLNVNLSYVNSYADNRDKMKQYNRVNGSTIWTKRYGRADRWKQSLSATYNKVLDGVNRDPDDPVSAAVAFGNWAFSASNRLAYQPNARFLKQVGLNLAVQTAHQVSYREYLYNDAYVLYTDAEQTGEVEGIYGPGIYTAADHTDGRPLNLSARLEANAVAGTFGIAHRLNFGTTVDYSKNRGLGRISDPGRPVKGLGRYSERYYDFSLLHPMWNMSVYLEDQLQFAVGGRPMDIRAGLRLDVQNGHTSFSPRANVHYSPSGDVRLGMAYGLSFKAPSLAHLHPGPTFMEFVLLNAYNGNASESTSRIFVYRFDPDPGQLRGQFSQTLEATAHWRRDGHSLSVHAFYKGNRQGFNTVAEYSVLTTAQYGRPTFVPGQKPVPVQNGQRAFLITPSSIQNSNNRDNLGFELLYSSPKVEKIYTFFVLAGGLTSSHSRNIYPSPRNYNSEGDKLTDIITAFYDPLRYRSYASQGRAGTVTHVPRLRLALELTADVQLMNKTNLTESQYVPRGYYTRDLEYHVIGRFDRTNPDHAFLYEQRRFEVEDANTTSNLIHANFHLNLAKEISENLRLSFSVHNFLDYQPRIGRETNTSVTILVPNGPPSYGAQLTYKF